MNIKKRFGVKIFTQKELMFFNKKRNMTFKPFVTRNSGDYKNLSFLSIN